MTIFSAIILGILEGATEFLPISSTFHLIWAARFLGVPQDDFTKLFEVVIQSGAILAVLVGVAPSLWKQKDMLKHLALSFLPTAIIGYILYTLIKSYFFEAPYLQLAVFTGVGALFIYLEGTWRHRSFSRPVQTLSNQQAALVGVAQALAVIPGVSRSGAVIVALMMMGFARKEAAEYSFLLAVPTLFSAAALDLVKMRNALSGNTEQLTLLAVGCIAAFVSALIVIRWFIRYLGKHSLASFGWYRLLLGLILFLLLRNF